MIRFSGGCGSKRKTKSYKDHIFTKDIVQNDDLVPQNTIFLNLLPVWKGQKKQGVRYAPALLNSMANEASDSGQNLVTHYYKDEIVNEVGEITEDSYTSHMNRLCRTISENLSELKTGDTVLNFGGDHSVAMATVQKMYHIHPDLRVIWIDAHADINSPQISKSGKNTASSS